jgi:hypothetical protein
MYEHVLVILLGLLENPKFMTFSGWSFTYLLFFDHTWNDYKTNNQISI